MDKLKEVIESYQHGLANNAPRTQAELDALIAAAADLAPAKQGVAADMSPNAVPATQPADTGQ